MPARSSRMNPVSAPTRLAAATAILTLACAPLPGAPPEPAALATRPPPREATPPDADAPLEVAFENPPARDPSRVGLGFFSHETTGARRNHVHADDFRVEDAFEVHAVRVWGLPEGSDGLDNFEALTLRIHTDADGHPGEILGSVTRPLTETAPSPTGRRGSGEGETTAAPEYVFEIRLADPVAVAAGRTHYVSITAHRREPDGANWQWQDGEHRDKIGWSRRLQEATWQRIQDVDSAFVVLGRRLDASAPTSGHE